MLSCALVLTLILFQKGQGFFPPLPIAALLPRSWYLAETNGDACDIPVLRGWFRCIHKQTCFSIHSWRCTYSASAAWDASVKNEYFCNAKGRQDFKSTLAFLASHEARCRMAVFTIQVTWNYTRPASRGTCRATAVKPRPSHTAPMPLRASAEKGAGL